jgi:site-specific DNA-methyltransferase (cytosine-N4-specific)
MRRHLGETCPHPARLTHGYHPYPAKFQARVPCRLLSAFAEPGCRVLDPFAGCGTTLVEALVHGCSATGVDIHPLAALISEVKTTRLTERQKAAARATAQWASLVAGLRSGDLGHNRTPIASLPADVPEFDNRDHWFCPEARRDLGLLRAKILTIRSRVLRSFLWVAMSSIIVRSSRQDSETRYKAVERTYPPGYALRAFSAKLARMLAEHDEFAAAVPEGVSATVLNVDIRDAGCLKTGSFDLVITSPPYANSYDYYLYHKQRMNWLGLDFRIAKNHEIGSRLQFSSQKAPIEVFLRDMTRAFVEIARAMAPKATCIVVQGDSRVRGVMHSGAEMIRDIVRTVGLSVVDSSSTRQAETSRLFNPTFAVKGKREHVIVLRKQPRRSPAAFPPKPAGAAKSGDERARGQGPAS